MENAIKKYWPVFLLPTLAAFIIGFIWPFIWGIYLSFHKFITVSKTTFVGIDNYIKVFQDATFVEAFWFTARFTIVSTILINVLAFALALTLTRGLKGTNAFRTVFFLPNLIGGIVLGYTWQSMINAVLANYGTTLVADWKYGYIGLIILVNWQQVGYMMVIYIAGLQNVPTELNEAAAIDGAGRWQTLRNVTIPMIMPTITICLFLTLSSAFKMFDQNLALTDGAPMDRTQMVALNIVKTMFSQIGRQGVGQAKAVLFVIVVVAIALIQLRATRSREVEA